MNIEGKTEVPTWLDTSDEEKPALIENTPRERDHTIQDSLPPLATDNSDITPSQKYALILSHILCLVTLALVGSWINQLGGLSWSDGEAKEVFNWHPLMMICTFDFMTVASLSFRIPCKSGSRYWVKATHVISWIVAIIFASVGLTAVFKSHNDGLSGYIANLYSLHSWLGILVISLYVCQFIVGTSFFALQFGTSSARESMMQLHVFFGPCIYNLTAFTIVSGILEKETFFNCSYDVTSPDLYPYLHFYDIPLECRISHFLGLIVILMAFCTSYALYNFPKGRFAG